MLAYSWPYSSAEMQLRELRIEGSPGSHFIFPLISASLLKVQPIKTHLYWHRCYAQLLQRDVTPSYASASQIFDSFATKHQLFESNHTANQSVLSQPAAGRAPRLHFFCCALEIFSTSLIAEHITDMVLVTLVIQTLILTAFKTQLCKRDSVADLLQAEL